MNITIVSFKVLKKIPKEKKFQLFKPKFKNKDYYVISIEYNIDEDRFYYNDQTKCIPTKKDLARSIFLIYDIYKRYEKFNLDNYFTLKTNNLENFLLQFFDSNNSETSFYYKKMIFGSKPVNIYLLNAVCEELKIEDIDFNNYYYLNYDDIEFK